MGGGGAKSDANAESKLGEIKGTKHGRGKLLLSHKKKKQVNSRNLSEKSGFAGKRVWTRKNEKFSWRGEEKKTERGTLKTKEGLKKILFRFQKGEKRGTA